MSQGAGAGCRCGRLEILFSWLAHATRWTAMRRLNAVLVGLGLGIALDASGAEEPREATSPPARAAPAPPTEPPRGVCTFNQPGLSMVIEDTTEQACRERRSQCGQDHPGHEADCRARWAASDEKAPRARKAKASGKTG